MSSVNLYPHQIEALKQTDNQNRVAVKGFEGLYEVDSSGRVFSVVQSRFKRKETLKPCEKNGYLAVNLYKEGKRKQYYVHRLIAEAFIPNPENMKEVNHIDCNKHNNSVENLEWCNRIFNLEHSYKNGLKRRGELHGGHKLTETQVCQIRQLLSNSVEQKEIARLFHVSQSTISTIKTARHWKEVIQK